MAEGAQRLIDNAEVIKQAVDLRGACLALDDCYEVWDSGFISIPYNFKLQDLPQMVRMLQSGQRPPAPGEEAAAAGALGSGEAASSSASGFESAAEDGTAAGLGFDEFGEIVGVVGALGVEDTAGEGGGLVGQLAGQVGGTGRRAMAPTAAVGPGHGALGAVSDRHTKAWGMVGRMNDGRGRAPRVVRASGRPGLRVQAVLRLPCAAPVRGGRLQSGCGLR